MENAAEALKIAFAVMMFVMALTLSISSFSSASSAIDAIIKMSDKVNEYTYVEPADGLYRTVGIDAVVSTIYRAIDANEYIAIYFKNAEYNADGSIDIESSIKNESIPLFYEMDITNEPTILKEMNCIDSSVESPDNEKLYLDVILGGTNAINDALIETFGDGADTEDKREDYREMYKKKIQIYPQGLYEAFKENEFIELSGEYYQDLGTSKIRKSVITYLIK